MFPIFKSNMRAKDKVMFFLSILFLIFVILIFIQAVRVDRSSQEFHAEMLRIDNAPEERQSISFIMGEDKDLKNTYYGNATAFFRNNPYARTDEVVTTCRSLTDIHHTLQKYYDINHKAYDTINIVVHSNPWSGISMPIANGGARITKDLLQDAYNNQLVKALANEIIDDKTKIIVHACGLGENTELTSLLQKVFGGTDSAKPDVIANKTYVNFTKGASYITKSEMEAFYAFYPTAYKPADLNLHKQFKKRYPNEKIEWLSAIQHKTKNEGIISHTYNVPIEWEIEYPEYDMPALESELDKLEWLMNQDELLEIVKKTNIPFDYFRWKVKAQNKIDEEYHSTPSIKVYGKVSILCVLREKNTNSKLKLNKA